MKGMMIGDAMSYPSMIRGRYLTRSWMNRAMTKIEEHGKNHNLIKPVLPFVWHDTDVLKPTPTYVSEFALFTANMLIDLGEDTSQEKIEAYWREHIVKNEQHIRSALSERAAIVNFQRGWKPPVTGNDHPHTYDDGFVARAIAIGICTYDQPELRACLIRWDGSVTHADDGMEAGAAMAETIASGMRGESFQKMVENGISKLSSESWVGVQCRKAVEIALRHHSPFAALPELDKEIISRIYNYGNLAPETLPITYALFLLSEGKMETAIPLANCFPRLSDSVPAFVGAMCGVYQGEKSIPRNYEHYLNLPKGVCIPDMKDIDPELLVDRLIAQKEKMDG